MVTRSAKLYEGENQIPVIDYSDFMIWEESEFGTRAWLGEGSASTIVIRDPLGEHDNVANIRSLAAQNLFVVQVDASYLWRGRVGIKNYSRDSQHVERYRQADTQFHDTNWDLDHITVHNYTRAAETDRARVQGLIASYLSASPRATTNLNGSNFMSSSNTVTLPATTYTRTTPLAILREISQTANKQFFVTGDTIGGGSLFYDGNDSTAYACTLSISDRSTEVNYSTVFPPIWNVGPASTEDGSEVLSEVYLFYGTEETQFARYVSETALYEHSWASGIFTDDTVADQQEANDRAQAILAHRAYEDKTYNVTIGPLTDAQVVLVKHGQTISIKARAIPDADDAPRVMRIAQCRYTTPIAGTWFAHLQLGRPWKMEPYSKGPVLVPQPPATGGSGALTCDNFATIGTLTSKWANSGVETNVTGWYDTPSDGAGERSSTQAHSGTWSIRGQTNHRWYVFDVQTFVAGTSYVFAFWARHDSNTSPRTVRVGHSLVADDVHWGPGDYEDLTSKTYLAETYDSGVWVQHCIVWTPASTYTDSVRIDFHFGASYLDDGEVYEGGAGILGPVDGGATGTSGTYAPLDHQHPLQECDCDSSGSGGAVGLWPAIGEPPSYSGTADNDFISDLGNYTAVSGSSGTVDLVQTTTTTAVYDLATRNGTLLMQAGHSQIVSFRCDYTLPDDRSIVIALAGATRGAGGDNYSLRVALNDDDSAHSAGNRIAAQIEQDADAFNVQGASSTDTTGLTIETNIQLPHRILLRIIRKTLTYTIFASYDGAAWVRVFSYTPAAALTNIWIAMVGSSGGQTFMPIAAVDFIVEGTATLDPW